MHSLLKKLLKDLPRRRLRYLLISLGKRRHGGMRLSRNLRRLGFHNSTLAVYSPGIEIEIYVLIKPSIVWETNAHSGL